MYAAHWHKKIRLLLVTDRKSAPLEICRAIAMALEAGARAIMLREKDLGPRELYDLALPIRNLTRRHNALLIVNHRLDVALAVEADGVQLGWRSLSVAPARKVVGPAMLIGASTHSVQEVEKAALDGADYVTYGPVFHTPSKEGIVEPKGLADFRQLKEYRIPVIGLGGIVPSNAESVFDAGANGVALIRAWQAAPDPRESVARLLELCRDE